MSRCGSCGAEIIWARTERGNRMPVDAFASDAGNILLTSCPETGADLAIVVKHDDTAAENELHTSHFVTCANAARHRRPRK